jgi:hypothetical protein
VNSFEIEIAQTPLEIKAVPMLNVYSRSQCTGQASHIVNPFNSRQALKTGLCVLVQSRAGIRDNG